MTIKDRDVTPTSGQEGDTEADTGAFLTSLDSIGAGGLDSSCN